MVFGYEEYTALLGFIFNVTREYRKETPLDGCTVLDLVLNASKLHRDGVV